MEKQHCDQCENQCPIDALQCGKGRKHFGLEPEGSGKPGREMPGGALGLLMQCGHFLHHGGADGADLSALNPAEQAELERLLAVLLTDWKKRMPSERKMLLILLLFPQMRRRFPVSFD